jgi:dihydropyrimidinase
MRVLIKNGTVITATETMPADVLIEGEKIAAIFTREREGFTDKIIDAMLQTASDKIIDASGRYVIPGGIDIHTHMELPFGGTVVSDSFESGTRAAAFGGTTTIVDFAVQVKGESIMEGFENWMEKATGSCAVDY